MRKIDNRVVFSDGQSVETNISIDTLTKLQDLPLSALNEVLGPQFPTLSLVNDDPNITPNHYVGQRIYRPHNPEYPDITIGPGEVTKIHSDGMTTVKFHNGRTDVAVRGYKNFKPIPKLKDGDPVFDQDGEHRTVAHIGFLSGNIFVDGHRYDPQTLIGIDSGWIIPAPPTKFKVGDRVRHVVGDLGTVKEICSSHINVRFDEDDCNSKYTLDGCTLDLPEREPLIELYKPEFKLHQIVERNDGTLGQICAIDEEDYITVKFTSGHSFTYRPDGSRRLEDSSITPYIH